MACFPSQDETLGLRTAHFEIFSKLGFAAVAIVECCRTTPDRRNVIELTVSTPWPRCV